MWNLVLVHLDTILMLVSLEIALILTPDRTTVGAKRSIGLKSFWMHPMGLVGDMGQVESRLGPFGDSVNIGAR
jgi:hypothetical protein